MDLPFRPAGPGEGYFEDDAPIRRVNRELIVAFSGARALLLQAAHPVMFEGFYDRTTGLGWGGGYSGHGVVASSVAGRTLADLVLGRETGLTSLPWVGHGTRAWELEPLRWLGAHGVSALLASADRVEDRTGRPARRSRLVARFAPGR